MKTILVIDDEPFMLELVRKILEAARYQVVTATSADSGLDAYRRAQPDVVITDLIMPEKDGLEAIQELLRLNPRARVIAMSGGGRSGYANALPAAKAFGAIETLRKPFPPDMLLAAVTRALDGL
jgi:two-component system, chemotaxis family, chemotaxis protein CheY